MPEVGNLSNNQGETAGSPLNEAQLAKLLGQHLLSLQAAGLTHIPKRTGESTLDLQQLLATAESDALPLAEATAAPADSTDKNYSPSNPNHSASEIKEAPRPNYSETTATNKPAAAPTINPANFDVSQRLTTPQREEALQILQTEISKCTRCDDLAKMRTQTVFGVGSPNARLVFVGEAPGADEDRIGEPFVGEAGKLLDKILTACKLQRENIFILNTIKCRPPGNRNPSQDELANCWGYAERQLDIIQPEFICCLGSVAARTLLKTTQSLGKLRKQFHSYRGSRVLVTYHPAYLLRTPSAKRHVWEDMKMLMKEMGVELSN
ncbi:uracil-DNA glycosylase [Mariniblastus sp.]|nr:uracil-DNA glycosylase [Mariniblastus sp.]